MATKYRPKNYIEGLEVNDINANMWVCNQHRRFSLFDTGSFYTASSTGFRRIGIIREAVRINGKRWAFADNFHNINCVRKRG